MNRKSRVCYRFVESPIGQLLVTAEGPLLTGLYLSGHKGGPTPQPEWYRADEPFDVVRRQLEAYFAGRLRTFDLPLRMVGTPFQRRVWQELARIPFGATNTYAELAARIGRSGAARAVGHANARNPVSIIVPCHRVIRAGGALGGYGGGVEVKQRLIEFEHKVAAADMEPAPTRAANEEQGYSGRSTVSRFPSMAVKSVSS